MTIGLLIALTLTIVAFLVFLDRRDRREREERATLLIHIQAPQIAVAQHATPGLPTVDPMPMTDEQLAEYQEHRSLLSYVQQVESNGGPLA